jgi:hypothetical protein
MSHQGSFAVHQAVGAHYSSAEGFSDGLMPETNAQ